MHDVWRIVLSEQWDVLCAVEHKDHRNVGLISYLRVTHYVMLAMFMGSILGL